MSNWLGRKEGLEVSYPRCNAEGDESGARASKEPRKGAVKAAKARAQRL